jgi:adenosylcobinamide-GDP ribazoletransferase
LISARRIRGALSFLTRVPAGTGSVSPEEMATWVPFFPIVGALIGLSGAAAYLGARQLWSPLVAATLAVVVEVVITGGLHEDGLGDTADAFGGASDPADARRILNDPRLGTFGVLAVLLIVVLRIGTLASLDRWSAVAALIAGHATARAAAISVLGYEPVSTDSGLGAAYARAIQTPGVVAAIAWGLLIATVAIGPWVIPAAALSTCVAWGVGRGARRRLGGVSGDVLGAIQQCALVAVLLLAAAAETHAWSPLAWWR